MFSDKEIIISKAKNVVTTLREEKLAFSRMMIISKTQSDFCLEKVIGQYELTNIPPSNFSADGEMILAKSNEIIIELLNEIPTSEPIHPCTADYRCSLILDGMDLLESLKSVKPMENVGQLVNKFMTKLNSELNVSTNYAEVRLIFPRFVHNSLSVFSSRKKYGSANNIKQYHITDQTPIKKLDNFLAHIDTRIELTQFLGTKVLESFARSKIVIVVAYGNMLYCNDRHHRSTLLNVAHNLEEIPQLILLNAVDLKNNGVERVYIKSTSVDALVVLLGHKDVIPLDTIVMRSSRVISISELYQRIGRKLSTALIGWYAMQGEIYRNCLRVK